MGGDRLWITPIVRMEILYSARSTSEYTAVETELDGFRILRNDRAVADAAMSAVGELAEHSDGYHPPRATDRRADRRSRCRARRHRTTSPRHPLRQARRSPHIRERRASRALTRSPQSGQTPQPPVAYETPRHRRDCRTKPSTRTCAALAMTAVESAGSAAAEQSAPRPSDDIGGSRPHP